MTYPMPSETDAAVIVRFPNRSGAIVHVIELTRTHVGTSDGTTKYAAECTGCADNSKITITAGELVPLTLSDARSWAVKHSADCSALPRPENAPSADRLDAAARLLDRALGLAESRDRIPRQMTGADQASVSTLTALASALISLHGAQ